MPLRAEDSIQKLLLSSTSRLVGEYREDDFLIAHAWQAFGRRDSFQRILEGPLSRNSFVFSFRAEQPEPRPGVVIPEYSGVGELVASYLCVLFGKRFDSHGPLESSGMFHVPDFYEYSQTCWPWLPQNSHHPRTDLGVPLNLEECVRIVPLLTDNTNAPDLVPSFQTACRFYMRALHAIERDPEIAYLHLITVGELLGAQKKYPKAELLDPLASELLEKVRSGLEDGSSVAQQIESRLFQVRRAFVRVLTELIDDEFFSRREATNDYEALKRETFAISVKAAYDLRSRYVHVGSPFGRWVNGSSPGHLAEVQVGKPVVADSDFATVLHRAPTLVGLERVMRYALFRFAEQSGLIGPRRPPSPTGTTTDIVSPSQTGVA